MMICIEQNLFATSLILYTTSSTWSYSYVNIIQSNVKNCLYAQDFIVKVNKVHAATPIYIASSPKEEISQLQCLTNCNTYW